jgi:hypothetical protein
MSGPHGHKKGNNYAAGISQWLYDATPKAVFAAIAVSPAINGGVTVEVNDTEDAYVLREWALLHQQGIVPQAPPKRPA